MIKSPFCAAIDDFKLYSCHKSFQYLEDECISKLTYARNACDSLELKDVFETMELRRTPVISIIEPSVALSEPSVTLSNLNSRVNESNSA